MIITAAVETISTGAIELTTVDCAVYQEGFSQLRRTLPEGTRMLSVRVDRG